MKNYSFYFLSILLSILVILFEITPLEGLAGPVTHYSAVAGRNGDDSLANTDDSYEQEGLAHPYAQKARENDEWYFASASEENSPLKTGETDCIYSLWGYPAFAPIYPDSCSSEITGMHVYHQVYISGPPSGLFVFIFNDTESFILSLDFDGNYVWEFYEIWYGQDCTYYYGYSILPLEEGCNEVSYHVSDVCVLFTNGPKPYYCTGLTADQLYICPSESWSVQPDVLCAIETDNFTLCDDFPFGFGISTEINPYLESDFLFFATINPCNGDSVAAFPPDIVSSASGPVFLHYGYLDSSFGISQFISLNNEFYQLSLLCDTEGSPCNDGDIWTTNDNMNELGQCVGTPVTDSQPMQLTYLPFDCDFFEGSIAIHFTITGGLPPYEVSGNYSGVLDVGEFECSYEEGESIELYIIDGSGATYQFLPSVLCPGCDVADFLIADISPQTLCMNETIEAIVYPNLSQLNCFDYTIYYFISASSSPVFNNALAFNSTGVFSYADINFAQPNQTYYLTAVAVSDMNGAANNFQEEYFLYSSPKPFRYTNCNAPVAHPDDLGIYPEGESVTVHYSDLLDNDEGLSLQITEIGSCENGINTLGNMSFTYSDYALYYPLANYSGNDTICYTIISNDGQESSSYFVLHISPAEPCPVQIEVMGLYCEANAGSLCDFGLYTYEYEWRIHSYAGASCTMSLDGVGDTTFIADASGYSYFSLVTSQPLVNGEVADNAGDCSPQNFQLVSIPCDTAGDLIHISPLSAEDLLVCRGDDYIVSPAMYCINPSNLNTMYFGHYGFAISDTFLQDAVWKDIWAMDFFNPIAGDLNGHFPASLFQNPQQLYLSFGYYTVVEADTHFISVIDSSYLLNLIDFHPDLVADTVYLSGDATVDIPCTYAQCYWSSGGSGDHTLSEEGWGWVNIISDEGCEFRDSFYVQRISGLDKPASASCTGLVYSGESQWTIAGAIYGEAWQLTLYTTTGQKIWYEQGRGVSNVSISPSLSRGIYLVKIEWEDSICVQKICINGGR